MTLEIANAHYQPYDFYCGRPRRGGFSPLGNPFKSGDHRGDAVELYGRWLWAQIKRQQPNVMQALLDIQKFEQAHGVARLACWCAPRRCHVERIVAALQSSEVLEILDEYRILKGSKPA